MDPEALVQIWHNVQFDSYLLFLNVKQAEYKRTVSPLLSRPQQQGVFHVFLLPVLLSPFSHKDTEAVSPFSLHPFLNPNVSSLLFLSFFFFFYYHITFLGLFYCPSFFSCCFLHCFHHPCTRALCSLISCAWKIHMTALIINKEAQLKSREGTIDYSSKDPKDKRE